MNVPNTHTYDKFVNKFLRDPLLNVSVYLKGGKMGGNTPWLYSSLIYCLSTCDPFLVSKAFFIF